MAELDNPRLQKLLANPRFIALEKSNPEQAQAALSQALREIANSTPVATPSAAPGPSAAPTAAAGPPPSAPPKSLSLDDIRQMMAQHNLLGPTYEKYAQKIRQPIQNFWENRPPGNTLERWVGPTLAPLILKFSDPANLIPPTTGQAATQAMMMAPGFGELGLGARLGLAPIVGAATSAATGSAESPINAAINAETGQALAETGVQAHRLHTGGAGSGNILPQLAEDLEHQGGVLATRRPDLVPGWLQTAAEFKNWFATHPRTHWGHLLDRAGKLKNWADAEEGLLKHNPFPRWIANAEGRDNPFAQKVADIEKAIAKEPANKQGYWRNKLLAPAQAEYNQWEQQKAQKVFELQQQMGAWEKKITDRVGNLRGQMKALGAEYHRRAAPFEALGEWFGDPKSYHAYGERFPELVHDTLGLQEKLGNVKWIRKLLDAGLTEDDVNAMRRGAFRKPEDTPAGEIMSHKDVPPVALNPGIRAHFYKPPAPSTIFHFDVPRPAHLSGNPPSLRPNPALDKLLRQIGQYVGFGFGRTFLEPNLEIDPDGNVVPGTNR